MLGAALTLAACSGDDGGSPTTTAAGDGAPTATSVTVPVEGLQDIGGEGLDGIVLARALVQDEDLPGFETRSVARPFRADEAEGLLLCGQDVRAAVGLVDGVQSVLEHEGVQVTVTVSAAADAVEAASFLDRIVDVSSSCRRSWTQEAPLLGAGPLEAEIVGEVDVGSPGPPVRAFRLRTTTAAGTSDVVVAVVIVGPVVTTVTVAGPAGADLDEATEAVAAAARRAVLLVRDLE